MTRVNDVTSSLADVSCKQGHRRVYCSCLAGYLPLVSNKSKKELESSRLLVKGNNVGVWGADFCILIAATTHVNVTVPDGSSVELPKIISTSPPPLTPLSSSPSSLEFLVGGAIMSTGEQGEMTSERLREEWSMQAVQSDPGFYSPPVNKNKTWATWVSEEGVRQWQTEKVHWYWSGYCRFQWRTKTDFCRCIVRHSRFPSFVIHQQYRCPSVTDWRTFRQYWRNAHIWKMDGWMTVTDGGVTPPSGEWTIPTLFLHCCHPETRIFLLLKSHDPLYRR